MVDAQASVRRLHWWTDLNRGAGANLRLGACLAFVAGATNAGGFLALGYYTSHMTGLLSSIADNLVLGQLQLVLGAVAAIAAFVSGAVTTAWMVNWGLRRRLRSAFARPLLVEAVLLLLFGVFGSGITLSSALFVPLTLLVLCYIMGLQNALITKASKAEIRTTHVTGLMTDIGIEIGKMLYINRSAVPTRVTANRQKVRLQLVLILSFFIGGVAGALGFKHLGYSATVPLALLLLVLVSGPILYDLRHGHIAPRPPSAH